MTEQPQPQKLITDLSPIEFTEEFIKAQTRFYEAQTYLNMFAVEFERRKQLERSQAQEAKDSE